MKFKIMFIKGFVRMLELIKMLI